MGASIIGQQELIECWVRSLGIRRIGNVYMRETGYLVSTGNLTIIHR